jgi:hypothetical protein
MSVIEQTDCLGAMAESKDSAPEAFGIGDGSKFPFK